MRSFLIYFLLLTISLSLSNQAQSEDWPQWRGPERNAQSQERLASKDWKANPPKHLWTKSGYGAGYASVSIVDGVLYTVGNTGKGQAVIAADAATGEIKWNKLITEADPKHAWEGSRCTPTVSDDKLYVVTSDGALHCLKKATGEVVWTDKKDSYDGKMMSGWGYSESPLVDGDKVLWTPGGADAEVVCLNKLTGKLIWKCKSKFDGESGKEGAGYSSIVISEALGIKQYVQLTGQGVLGIDASTGKMLWSYSRVANKIANISTCIIDGNFIFASTSYDTGACLLELKKEGDKIVAEEKYFLPGKTFNNHHGGMVLIGGYVYAGHQRNEGFPTCIDMKSGEIVWGGKLRGAGKGSAAVLYIDDHLIFRYEDGTMALIEASPKDYMLKGTFTPEFQQGKSWAHPVIVNGKMYLREQDKLMCYQVGP